MKKSYMRKAYSGMVGDMKNLEHHFSVMAEQGWLIEKIGLFTHRYRSVEPCKKYFFVDFLPQITAFDYPENDDVKNYRAICEESGWTFVAANKQFHVFCADGENPSPIPIHTDNKTQARIYLKACRKYELPVFLYALIMLWFFSPLGKGIELFLSNIMLLMAIGYGFFSIGYFWNFGFMLRWYLRTRNSAKKNLPMPTVSYRLARLRINVSNGVLIIFLMCAVIGVVLEIIGGMPIVFLLALLMPLSALGVGLWIRRQVDTKCRTRADNIRLTIVTIIVMEIVFLAVMGFITHSAISISSPFNSDSLGNRPALTLNDVAVTTEPSHSSTRTKGTIAVPIDYEHWESASGGSVNTHVYRSISKILTYRLYNHYTKEFMENFADRLSSKPEGVVTLTTEEAAIWGAKKGMAFYHANSNAIQLLLLNDKTILQLSAEGVDMNLDAVSQAVQSLWSD